jgi:arylsulfatase
MKNKTILTALSLAPGAAIALGALLTASAFAADNPAFPVKVDEAVYPPAEYRYPNAKIGVTYKDSTPDFPPTRPAPAGAPNVLLVLVDDVGFGFPSGTGGLIKMPTMERLAKNGLTYTEFHTTALCSPTRAALLTGRNHHSAASGVIQEMATGYPGYSGIIPKGCATSATLLGKNGYTCAWFGKNHNVPDNQTSAAGPFDNWPTRQGFDCFYGFIGGETDQFYPMLVRNRDPVQPPKTPEQGYHLTTDLADECIAWIRQQKTITPNRPVFAYLSTGATHAPHQPPLSWRGRHKGQFDMGWDKYRELVWKRQLELGVIPPGTKLTPRPKEIPAWDEQTAEGKKLFARQAENFADFLEHTDYEAGRVVDSLEKMGELDNTLVIYILGDNGCSAEGTLIGTINEIMNLNGLQSTIDQMLPRIDDIGKPGTAPHFAVGWAWAGDTPFQWTKQVASHFGGTRNGMVISWPKRITDVGTRRFQFHHAIDITPTILEVAGIAEPSMVDGFPQKPIEGVSLAYTFDKANASAPSHRTTQYFEMLGNRAIYNDGWIAAARHGRLPWIGAGSFGFDQDKWELYHITEDFSEANDLAAQNPAKVRELQDLFMTQAARYNVLPLDDRMSERMDVTLRPSFFAGRNSITFYPGMVRLPEGSAPKTTSVSHTITASVEIPKDGAEGVIMCVGGDVAGWALTVENGKAIYHYNWFNIEKYAFATDQPLPTGKVELKVDFVNEGKTPGGPASVTLYVNGQKAGEGKIKRQVPQRFGVECLDIGQDSLSPVSASYEHKLPFKFTGTIEKVTLDLKPTDQAAYEKEKSDADRAIAAATQ